MKHSAHIVVGMAYGDEGKGATVDFLVRKRNAGLVVRFNGGPQALHNVVTPDIRHHGFSQFGSGTFVPSVRTHLSRFMLVNPMNMMEEADHLRILGVLDALERISVDPRALIITPFQREVNRILAIGHNTCGQGVGQTRSDSLRYGDDGTLFAGDLLDETVMRRKLKFIQGVSCCAVSGRVTAMLVDSEAIDWCVSRYTAWARLGMVNDDLTELLDMTSSVVFEGAQAVLLDETHGDYGFNSWTNTTFDNALTLLRDCGYDGTVTKVGVFRSYFTRHGDGPFVESPGDYYWDRPEMHNVTDKYMGRFRVGQFDFVAAKRAIEIAKPDWLAINHLDAFRPTSPVGRPYLVHIPQPAFLAKIEDELGVPVMIKGYGPSAD